MIHQEMMPWTEKYRPRQFSDYVWQSETIKNRFQNYINTRQVPSLLLSGPPGTGKTSMFTMLMSELNISSGDYLDVNSGRKGNIDDVRGEINGFITLTAFGEGHKYVHLGEANGMTPKAQLALLDDIEKYSHSVRWILTTNHEHLIIPALRDRLEILRFERPNKDEFKARLLDILIKEEVEFPDIDNLEDNIDTIIKTSYPSLRKAILAIEAASITGKFELDIETQDDSIQWKLKTTQLFKEGKVTEARTYLCDNITKDEIQPFYKWMYDNSSLFNDEQEAILIINKGMVESGTAFDQEITLSSTLVELSRL